MGFAENLQKYRIAAGYKSARAFSEAVGLSQSTYFNYEKGTREPGLEMVSKIAAALHVSPADLLGFNESDELEKKKNIVRRAGFKIEEKEGDNYITVLMETPIFIKEKNPKAPDTIPVSFDRDQFCEWVSKSQREYDEYKKKRLHDFLYESWIQGVITFQQLKESMSFKNDK